MTPFIYISTPNNNINHVAASFIVVNFFFLGDFRMLKPHIKAEVDFLDPLPTALALVCTGVAPNPPEINSKIRLN